jgi:hypothetical protein
MSTFLLAIGIMTAVFGRVRISLTSWIALRAKNDERRSHQVFEMDG